MQRNRCEPSPCRWACRTTRSRSRPTQSRRETISSRRHRRSARQAGGEWRSSRTIPTWAARPAQPGARFRRSPGSWFRWPTPDHARGSSAFAFRSGPSSPGTPCAVGSDRPMCGLAGILSFDGAPIDREELTRQGEALRHRGPDAQGIHVDAAASPGLGLVHRRLSIIDLSNRADQPIANEDGTVLAMLNGEIYNFPELRRSLAVRHSLRSAGVTDVVATYC